MVKKYSQLSESSKKKLESTMEIVHKSGISITEIKKFGRIECNKKLGTRLKNKSSFNGFIRTINQIEQYRFEKISKRFLNNRNFKANAYLNQKDLLEQYFEQVFNLPDVQSSNKKTYKKFKNKLKTSFSIFRNYMKKNNWNEVLSQYINDYNYLIDKTFKNKSFPFNSIKFHRILLVCIVKFQKNKKLWSDLIEVRPSSLLNKLMCFSQKRDMKCIKNKFQEQIDWFDEFFRNRVNKVSKKSYKIVQSRLFLDFYKFKR